MKSILRHHERNTHFDFEFPDGKGSFPIVLFSHGYNGCMTDFDDVRKLLLENGIASAALTFSGGSTRDKSGFPSTDMTLDTEKEDLLALVNWAESMEKIDRTRMFLFGASMGGIVSCLAVKEIEKKIRAMILLYPALCIVDDWNERFKEISDIPDRMMFWNLLLGKNFFISMRRLKVFPMISCLKIKTMIFHGDQDVIVPIQYSEKAAEMLAEAGLTVFKGEGHGFTADAGRKMEMLTLAFIKQNL